MNKPPISLYICILTLIGIATIVFLNKPSFERATLTLPTGKIVNIEMPFDSQKDGSIGTYTYEVNFRSSIFFSGLLQILPDDCVEEIRLNGVLLTSKDYNLGNCDYKNGFYLHLKKLNSGYNKLQFRIRNTGGVYGVKIYDKTFYEKYVIFVFLIFILCFVRLKHIHLLISCFRQIIERNQNMIKLQVTLIVLFFLTLSSSILFAPSSSWYWPLTIQFNLMFFAPFSFWLVKNFSYNKSILIIWVVVFLILIWYLAGLSHTMYSYDYRGHIEYVKYMVLHGESPVSDGGWSFYHPSFYYRLASVNWHILNLNGHMTSAQFLKSIQSLSLAIFTLYLFYSLKAIHIFFLHCTDKPNVRLRDRLQLLTSVILLCWPSNSIVSVRVGNDVLFDLLFAMSFYYCLKWFFTGRSHNFFLSLVFATLCVWAKTNGFILHAILGLLLAIRMLRTGFKIRQGRLPIIFILVSVATAYYAFNQQIKQVLSHNNSNLVVANASGLGPYLRVESGLKNFTSFNIKDFVEIPFTSSSDDNLGRTSFWTYLFKTSLFGEFSIESKELAMLAKILSLLLLVFLAFSIYGLVKGVLNFKLYLPMLVSLCLMIFSMAMFRVFYPYSCANDFRYIYPALIPFLIFTSGSVSSTADKNLAYYFLTVTGIAFVITALTFQIITIIEFGYL
jgi:hypothetical protein